MQKYRSFFNVALLVSALGILPGCDLFKPASCPTCKPVTEPPAKQEDVLLSINGKPAITKQKFEDFYDLAAAQAGPYGGPSKREVFKQIEAMAVLDNYFKTSGKEAEAEYQKELARAYDHARWGLNTQLLAKELQEKIDVSESALTKFYNEQIGANQAFDRPPFLKHPESISIKAVEFTDKKAANDFLAKAKKDFAGAAAEAGKSTKDLGPVSAQSQDVDFAIRLKAKSLKPGDVEVVQTGDTFTVIKGGNKVDAAYASFDEIKAMPQMLEMLGQFKKQSELEKAFMDRIEELKKGLSLSTSDEYFKADEEQRKAEQEQLMKLFEEQMKAQQENTKGDNAAQSSGAVAA